MSASVRFVTTSIRLIAAPGTKTALCVDRSCCVISSYASSQLSGLWRHQGPDLLVSLSDKVHNARSILRDLRKQEIGSAVWSRFGKRPKEDTLWYDRQLASEL